MSARASFKGYLFQTLICLLDALNESEDWVSFAIEPDEEATKVDILWESPESTRAVQVKSSVRPFSKSDVERWASQLEDDVDADSYELVLIGTTSRTVAGQRMFGSVNVPLPRQNNPVEMIYQAAHRLDIYLEKRNFSRVPPLVRELIVDGLVSRLAMFSTQGTRIDRSEFDDILRDWILSLYPESIDEIRETYCEVLGNTINFWPQDNRLVLGMPLEFVNCGRQIAIIEYLVLRLICDQEIIEYHYVSSFPAETDVLQGGKISPSLEQAREIAVLPNATVGKHFVFMADQEPECLFQGDGVKEFSTELFVKYRGRSVWMMQQRIDHTPHKDFYRKLRLGQAQFNTVHPDTSCINRSG